MADQKVENVFERRRAPPPPLRLERTPPPSNVSTISFHRDRSQPEVKTEAAPEEPTVEEAPPSAPGISFEAAVQLGLLQDIAREPPAEAPTASEPEAAAGGLTPDKFEEALRKGLFGE
jgi:hypothetical protein